MNRNKNSTRLGVDRVKPGNSVRINLFLGLRGPDIRLGLNNRHRRSQKVMEGHGKPRKVKEGHGWSFPITRLTYQVRKVMGGWGGVGWGGSL